MSDDCKAQQASGNGAVPTCGLCRNPYALGKREAKFTMCSHCKQTTCETCFCNEDFLFPKEMAVEDMSEDARTHSTARADGTHYWCSDCFFCPSNGIHSKDEDAGLVDGYEADVDTPVSSQTNNALRATPGNEMLPSSQQDMFATPTQEHALKVAAGAAASEHYLSDDNSGHVGGSPSPGIDSKLGQTRKRKSVAGREIKTPIKARRSQKLAAPGSRSGSSQGSQDSQRSSQGGQGGGRRSSQPERAESNAETGDGESDDDDIPCSQEYLQSVGTSTKAASVATPRYSLEDFEDALGGKLDVAGVNFKDVGGALYSKKHRAAYKLARKRHVDDSSTFEFVWPDNRISRVCYDKGRKQYCTTFLPVE
eukprot:gene15934-8471_t